MPLQQTQTFNFSGNGTYSCAEGEKVLQWVEDTFPPDAIFRLMDEAEVAAELKYDHVNERWGVELYQTTNTHSCLTNGVNQTARSYYTQGGTTPDSPYENPIQGSFGTWSTDDILGDGDLNAGSGPSASGDNVPTGSSETSVYGMMQLL